jgi:very-short-patch-repair endonuclease
MQIPGVILKTDLPALEPSAHRRQVWRKDGTIRAVGSWYVTSEAPSDLTALLEAGVRPTCLDAAALHGLWVPRASGVHAFRPRTLVAAPGAPLLQQIRRIIDPRTGALVPLPEPEPGKPPRVPQSLVLHGPSGRSWPDDDPVPGLLLTLEHAARCLPTLHAAILIESALNQGKLDRVRLDQLLARIPQRSRIPLSRVRSDAQSGTETAVRWWLEERRVSVRTQVQVVPGIRVDLLIGTNWVIECDSRRFHDDPEQYREDRRRDLVLAGLGYRVTRLTWEQVFLDWERTAVVLLRILHRREHRRALPV